MRLARDLGTVRELFPEGIESVTDLPHTLFNHIRFALTFLSFEELPREEQPPKRIWLDGEKLSEWFKAVEKQREEKFGGKGGDGPGPIDDPVKNDAAKALIAG